MMTVQEIQEIGFEKAVFNGYDMKSVDTFLERVAEEFSAAQKENAALKAKMKVLVDKIEEYRGVEDGMRRTLVSAQSVAQETIEKAKADAAEMINNAREQSEGKVQDLQEQIQMEEQKLELAKKNTIEFIARVSNVYKAQAKALVELAKSENLVRAKQDAPNAAPAQANNQQQPAEAEQNLLDSPVRADAPEAEQGDTPVSDATRRFNTAEVRSKDFNFGELKFGNDYDPKEGN